MITKLQARGKPLEEKNKIWAKRHEWGGEKVHQLVLDMSGFYVKSAQILASKADFVPDAWRTWLSKHLDSAPPRPFREIRKSIEEQLVLSPFYSLGKTCSRSVSLSEVFSNVDPDPIAAASIAQVHGAQLKDGTRVVLKVQHLGMERIMHSDLRNLGRVANFLKGQLPVDLGPIVKEIQTCIPLEFDFEREVWFMEKIRNSLAAHGFNRIVCPSPFNELSTKCLIVMERLDGVPFTRILEQNPDEEIQRKRLVEVKDLMLFLVEAYGQMVLLDGIFHADPHAGNLLLLSDGRLGLLDFGQSKVLDECTRKGFAKMVLALANNDEMAIAFALVDLGMRFENAGGDTPPVNILAKMARMLFDTCYVEEATVSPMADNSILRTTPLKSFNQSLWMVVRAILILRGLLYTLKMDISAVTIWQPYALRALEN